MSIKKCESCNIKCGFDNEISNLVENNSTFMQNWKTAYKTMDPEEIISFLNYWVEEIIELTDSDLDLDPLSKGIILNCLFRELIVDHYPGPLIPKNLTEELIDKMRNKTNPFEKIRIEIEEMIRNKKYSKIEEEIQKVLSSYSKENNEIIDVAINNFLLQVINNYKDTEFDVKVLGNVTSVYLDFIDNKDSDLNTAVFFLRLASHFNDKKEKSIAKNCLLKSKEIYNRLGLSKDVAKVDRILSKFVEIKTVVKKVKTVKKSKAKTKKKKKKKTKKKAKKP